MRGFFQRLRVISGVESPVLGYVLRLLAYLAVFAVALDRLPGAVSESLKTGTAALTASALGIFIDAVTQRADIVTYSGFAVQIIEECFGLFEMAIFAAAVLAFPAPWRARWLGLAAGLPMIYSFNVLRITMLLVVGHNTPSLFEFAHLYFWQGTLIVMITGFWLLWVRFAVRG